MRLIQCPDVFSNEDMEEAVKSRTPALFLGGGITNCENWQDRLVELLKDENVIIVNPRRKEFDINDPEMAGKQIEWEYDHFVKTGWHLFWFAPETLCPITLFEYGRWLTAHSIALEMGEVGPLLKLFVGVHENYARRFDVLKQTEVTTREYQDELVTPVNSIEELANQVKQASQEAQT